MKDFILIGKNSIECLFFIRNKKRLNEIIFSHEFSQYMENWTKENSCIDGAVS
jgi:hypothetical protein